MGGAGNFALCSVIFLELVPKEKYAVYTSSVSVVYSLSLLLGPILGGAINVSSTWRWVFLLKSANAPSLSALKLTCECYSIPPGVLAGILVIFCIPTHFPYHGQSGYQTRSISAKLSKATLDRVDFLGAFVLLVATLFLVAALEEAGTHYPWKSAFVITLLTISGILWIAFLLWERRVTLAAKVPEPVFPWRFVQSRVWIGMLLYVRMIVYSR